MKTHKRKEQPVDLDVLARSVTRCSCSVNVLGYGWLLHITESVKGTKRLFERFVSRSVRYVRAICSLRHNSVHGICTMCKKLVADICQILTEIRAKLPLHWQHHIKLEHAIPTAEKVSLTYLRRVQVA